MQEILFKFLWKFIKITPEIGREIFKPDLTKEEKVELVEKCRLLKSLFLRSKRGWIKSNLAKNLKVLHKYCIANFSKNLKFMHKYY